MCGIQRQVSKGSIRANTGGIGREFSHTSRRYGVVIGTPHYRGYRATYPRLLMTDLFQSVTFTQPPETSVKEFGYTWDDSVYGGTTPIHSSFPPFQWADRLIVHDALKEMDIPSLEECAGGDKAGICWIPTSQHPTTSRRSHSGLGHYAAVNTTRDNYDLLVQHQALRVLYPDGKAQDGRPPLVEVRSLSDGQLFNVTAKLEVIISAGALHTPTILHRSGLGPADILQKAGISTVVDLPGVGANLQDHSSSIIEWNCEYLYQENQVSPNF